MNKMNKYGTEDLNKNKIKSIMCPKFVSLLRKEEEEKDSQRMIRWVINVKYI